MARRPPRFPFQVPACPPPALLAALLSCAALPAPASSYRPTGLVQLRCYSLDGAWRWACTQEGLEVQQAGPFVVPQRHVLVVDQVAVTLSLPHPLLLRWTLMARTPRPELAQVFQGILDPEDYAGDPQGSLSLEDRLVFPLGLVLPPGTQLLFPCWIPGEARVREVIISGRLLLVHPQPPRAASAPP